MNMGNHLMTFGLTNRAIKKWVNALCLERTMVENVEYNIYLDESR